MYICIYCSSPATILIGTRFGIRPYVYWKMPRPEIRGTEKLSFFLKNSWTFRNVDPSLFSI